MKKLVLGLLFAASVVSTHSAYADGAKSDGFALIHASDLDTMMKKDKSNVHVYDANNDKVRATEGLIPTAEALSSSSHYDVATLPTDKNSKVVFYCMNTDCMASHDAAKVAAKAGYKNIFVMSDGIEGWKKAKMPTQKYVKKG